MRKSNLVQTKFVAVGVPAIQIKFSPRSEGRAEVETMNWKRLKKHIDRHEKAGGRVTVVSRRFEDTLQVEGRVIVELRDVTLDWAEGGE